MMATECNAEGQELSRDRNEKIVSTYTTILMIEHYDVKNTLLESLEVLISSVEGSVVKMNT